MRCPLNVTITRIHVTLFNTWNSGYTSTIVPLFNVFRSFPPGVSRRFAPPPAFAFTLPNIGAGSRVMVTVGVSVSGIVNSAVEETVNETVEVLEGRGLLVVVAGRLGVKEGSAEGCVAGTDGVTLASRFAPDGKPDPIKMKRIHTKRASAITLRKIPRTDGRSLKMKRVKRPRMPACAKCTTKTKTPCGQIPSKPEPRPKPPALTGK